MAVNRYYSSTAVDTTVASSVAAGDTTIVVTATTGFPTSYPYTLALDYDTSKEELINVVGASGTTLTVGVTVGVASTSGRGVDGTTAQTHSVGANVKHVISGRDMREAQEHIAASTSVHGITDTTALVTKTGTETLTNKTLTSPAIAGGTLSGTLTNNGVISGGSITGAAVTGGSITGAAITAGSITGSVGGNPTFTGTVVLPATTTVGSVSATELAYVDGVTSAIQTQLDAKAPLASPTFTGTVTLPTGTTVGAVSYAELSTLDGITTSVSLQTQLGNKVSKVDSKLYSTSSAEYLSYVEDPSVYGNVLKGPMSSVIPFTYFNYYSDATLVNSTALQPIFDPSADTFTVPSGGQYRVKLHLAIHSTGTTANAFQFNLVGTGTATPGGSLIANCSTGASFTTSTPVLTYLIDPAATYSVTPTSSASATYRTLVVEGFITLAKDTTLIPSIKYTAAPGATPIIDYCSMEISLLNQVTPGWNGPWA